MFQSVKEWFWTEKFWLQQGFNWSDIKNAPMSTLYSAFYVTIIILIVRCFFERYIALNICLYLGIADLEFEKNNARGLLKSGRQEARLKKATETCWRCFVYFIFFIYGAYVLFRTEWFWNTRAWREGYITTQPFTIELKVYYIIELSFYLALLLTFFKDTRRKDATQQLIHHIATIILISGSYIIAYFRFGAVIMLVHDASDYWLEAAKLAKYANKKRTCDALFVIFALVFYATRWIYYPFWVLSFMVDTGRKLAAVPLQPYFCFPYILVCFCFVLQVLHLYWGFLVGRVVYKFTVYGEVEKDERSDDEN